MPKYLKIRELDKLTRQEREALLADAYAFEKLDGNNCQVSVHGGTIKHAVRCGKLNKSTRNEFPWVREFEKFFWQNYRHFAELDEGIYFGEFLVPHHLEYKKEHLNTFFLIDVFDGKKFVPYEEAVERVRDMKGIIMPIEILQKGEMTKKKLNELLYGKSQYSLDGRREGIVLKSYDKQLFGKVLHPDFSDTEKK